MKKLRDDTGLTVPINEKTLDLWIREHLGANIKTEIKMDYEHLTFIVRKVSRSHVYEVIIERKQ